MRFITVAVWISYILLHEVKGGLVEVKHPVRPDDNAIYRCSSNHGFVIWDWNTLGTEWTAYFSYRFQSEGYRWEEVLEGSRISYNVTESSSSSFTVVATVNNPLNLNGTTITCGGQTVTIYIILRSPPEVTLQRSGGLNYDASRSAYIIIEGSVLVFNCSIQAGPETSVIWKHNGTEIQASTRHILASDITTSAQQHIVMIYNVIDEDSGHYSCNATNDYGTHEVTETIKVIVPPTVTALSEEVIGVVNRDNKSSEVVFGFRITRADPKVLLGNIRWYYLPDVFSPNWRSILRKLYLSDNRRGILVRNLAISDAGTFMMIATNEAGTHNASVKLIIHVEPELIDRNDIRSEIKELGVMSLWCFADGVPEPNIVWLHNESLILLDASSRHQVDTTTVPSSNRPNITTGVNSTLIITNVNLRDAGEYLCRVDPANIDKGRQYVPEPFVVVVYPTSIEYCQSKPCQNDGVCSNVINGYLCTCNPLKWKGVNCTEEILQFNSPSIDMSPMFEESPSLFTTAQVTCQVSGSPQPNITWYKDGVLLPGQRSQILILEEVSLKDRGRYHCEAQNYDPSKSQFDLLTDISEDTVLNIKGILQYKAELNISMNRRKRQASLMENSVVNEISARLSGARLPQYNATVLSVTGDSLATSRPDKIDVIITLLAQEGNADLRDILFNRLQQVAPEVSQNTQQQITLSDISRFDGCEAEDTVLEPMEPGGLSITIKWPESDLGERHVVQCPCGNLSTVSGQDIRNAKARRVCGGDFTRGGQWETPFISPCNFSSTTRRLCLVANVIREPEEALRTLDSITSNEGSIGSTEIGVTTILLEALQDTLGSNNQQQNLTKGFLTVVDNLLNASPEQIKESQEASNSSARILNVVETISKRVSFDNNQTQVIISLTSFAVAVQQVNLETFSGQVFSAGFGNFNFNKVDSIDTRSLSISQSGESSMSESSSLRIPSTIFKQDSFKSENTVSTRITNFVFLSDVLFSRRSTSASAGIEVGSIIMAASLSNDRAVENLNPPVVIIFQKKKSLHNETTTCRFWDFSSDDGFGDWSTRGCVVANETDTVIVCECNHLTNFAILLDPSPIIMPETSLKFVATLSALSYIGAIVSIICLIATIITYSSSKKLRASEAGQLLTNLCVAMLGLYIMYITSLHASRNKHVCALAGGLLHYFMLASFLAMAAEAVSLYTKLVLVIGVPPIIKNKYVLKTCLIVWIFPIFIVILSEAPNWNNYVSDYFCRPFNGAFYGGLLVPFIIIYIFNWVVFAAIFWSLLRKKASKVSKSSAIKLKQHVIIAVTLSLLFGLGWGVGLLATASIPVAGVSYTLQTFFVLLTSFQGLWIFIMNCIRSEEARKQWKVWIEIISCHKVNLEKRGSITGQTSSDNFKGRPSRYKLSISQASSTQTLLCIVKNDINSSIVGSDIIETEKSIFTPTLEPTVEKKTIDFATDALASLTPVIHASNPSIHIFDDDMEDSQSTMSVNGNELVVDQTRLDSLSIASDRKSNNETISLHSVNIINDMTSRDTDSKSPVNKKFDILWVKNGLVGGSCLSLKSEQSDQGTDMNRPNSCFDESSVTSFIAIPTTSPMELLPASETLLTTPFSVDVPDVPEAPTSEDCNSPDLIDDNESLEYD